MIISEAIRTKYDGFTRGQTAAINYFEFLASTNGVDISEYDAHKFLDQIDSQQKRDINKFFFNKFLNNQPTIEENPEDEVKKLADSYSEFAESKRRGETEYLKNRLTSLKGMITRHYNQAHDYLKEFHAHKIRLDILEDRKQDWFRIELEKVFKDKFWQYLGRDHNHIEFVTRGHVVLKDPAANFTVNMGKYKCRLRLDGFYCTIHSYKDNLHFSSEGLIHPYAHDGEEMCYGSGQDQASKFAKEGQIYNLFTLTKNTLTYYNPASNPYATLTQFKKHLDSIGSRDDQCTEWDECEDCGDRTPSDTMTDGRCEGCYIENYFYCDSCDEHYRNDDFGAKHDGALYCAHCDKEYEEEKQREEKEREQTTSEAASNESFY